MVSKSFYIFMLLLTIVTVSIELTMVFDGFERVRTSRTRQNGRGRRKE